MIIEHQREKLVEVVRYFSCQVKYLGKVKLFKLLYFLDFEHYRDTGRSVTGLDYAAWKMGPVPARLFEELKHPEPDWMGKVEFKEVSIKSGHSMFTVSAIGSPELAHFSKRELRIMSQLVEKYVDAQAEDMVEATHLENLPWHYVYVEQNKKQHQIPYELALRRQEAELMLASVKERDALVQALKG